MKSPKPTLGVVGAGKLGMVLSQLALKAGYEVYISGSGSADKIRLSVNVIAPGAKAVTTEDVAAQSDVIILALPLSKYEQIPAELFDDKLVIDAMNYWWEVDGKMPKLDAATSSSEMVQEFFPEARIAKALSHMGYHNLLDDARPAGAPDRRAIAIAGDRDEDNKIIASLVNDLGFDPVVIGGLTKGKVLEPGNQLFGASLNAEAVSATAESGGSAPED